MSFKMKIQFQAVRTSSLSVADLRRESERLALAGWCVQEDHPRQQTVRLTIEREIRQLYLAEVHWKQRFLGLEPTEISVVFQNSLFPRFTTNHLRFLDTHSRWLYLKSEIFSGFGYKVRTNIAEKTLEIRVSGGQQLGRENWKKFFRTLQSYHIATKIARELHQFRMAAGKQNVQEMDRHANEILDTLVCYLIR